MKETKIRIVPYEPLGVKWFKHLISFTAVILAPISLGIYMDSTAMQWMGFITTIMMVAGVATIMGDRYTVHTTDEARKLLDQIDAERA
jgi:hypothetical protein